MFELDNIIGHEEAPVVKKLEIVNRVEKERSWGFKPNKFNLSNKERELQNEINMLKRKLNNKEDRGHLKFDKVKCYNCGESGHYRNESPKRNTGWKKDSDSQSTFKETKAYEKSGKERQN